jgi:hypothetical protein
VSSPPSLRLWRYPYTYYEYRTKDETTIGRVGLPQGTALRSVDWDPRRFIIRGFETVLIEALAVSIETPLCHLYKNLYRGRPNSLFKTRQRRKRVDILLQSAMEEVNKVYYSIQHKFRYGMEASMVRWSYDIYAKEKLEARTKELLALTDRKHNKRLGRYSTSKRGTRCSKLSKRSMVAFTSSTKSSTRLISNY